VNPGSLSIFNVLQASLMKVIRYKISG